MSAKKPKVSFSKCIDSSLRHELFRKLQETTQVNEEGNVSWSGHSDVDQYISVLGDAFAFPPEFSRREAASAVWRGIIDARKSGKIADSSVLEALQRITDEKLSEPPGRFSMWSRLSYRPPIPPAKKLFTYADVSMQLSARLPLYMKLSEEDLSKLRPIPTKDTPGFGFLVASTQARNATQAADKIFSATEMFQSVYNLAMKPWNLMGSEQKPEAMLLLGPYQFLYRSRKAPY